MPARIDRPSRVTTGGTEANRGLREGARGTLVERLQTALNHAGFSAGSVDGAFGRDTTAAVKAFQQAEGLVVDGIAGPRVWEKLSTAAPRGPAKPAGWGTAPTSGPVSREEAPARQGWGAPSGRAPSDRLGGAARLVASQLHRAENHDYELRAGVYPGAVSLPAFLARAGQTPEGKAAIANIVGGFKAKTGITIPPDIQSAAVSNPGALLQAMEITPAQLSDGVRGLNLAHRAGKVQNPEPPKQLLPQKFELATIDAVKVPPQADDLKQIGPGLFTGDIASTISASEARHNRVMAEVFQRLSGNPSAPDDKKFEVVFRGKPYSKVEDFTKALQDQGYQVDVSFQTRVANFAALHTQVAGSNPPKYVDVPAPLMMKTGVLDSHGKEAVLPATHSEMVVSIRAGSKSPPPQVGADVKFFQGMSGTGFVPANLTESPAWCGGSTQGQLSGARAREALTLAAAFTDVVNTTAKDQHLYADGYGVTGVCNDSVAVVQQAVMGNAKQYPLLMRDDVLYGQLKKHLATASRHDQATYQALRKAIDDLPSDVRPNPSAKARALASMPWAQGREPFDSSVDARRILEE